MVQNDFSDWQFQAAGRTHFHCCLVLSGKPVIALHFKMLHYKCQTTQTFVSQGKQSPPSSHASSTSPFERTGEKAAFVISNLSRMERRGLQVKQGQEEHPCGFTKACTCKMYGFAFSLSPFICVSLARLSLCILLYRDWAVGRTLQSLLLKITANWRC